MRIVAPVMKVGPSSITGRVFTRELIENVAMQLNASSTLVVDDFDSWKYSLHQNPDPVIDLMKVIGHVIKAEVVGDELIATMEIHQKISTEYLNPGYESVPGIYSVAGYGSVDRDGRVQPDDYSVSAVVRTNDW